MAYRSKRCAPCDLNMPRSYPKCPVCQGETFDDTTDWQQSWSQEAERLKKRRNRLRTGLIPNSMGVLVEKDGRMFIAEKYLLDAGYDPQEFDVVKIRGTYFELCGRVGDDEIDAWWIEPIDVQREIAKLTEQLEVLTEVEYQALERARGLRE